MGWNVMFEDEVFKDNVYTSTEGAGAPASCFQEYKLM